MKVVLLLVCVLVAVLTVSAHGGGGGGGGGGRGGLGKGARQIGRFFFSCRSSDTGGRCDCSSGRRNTNICSGVVGTKVLGCPNTNKFIECTNDVCAPLTCTVGQQVWNKTLNACAPCAGGMHVSADNQVCACDQGTWYNSTTKSCVACPTDSTKDPDLCYCPITTSYDSTDNACKACPTGSTLTKDQECKCSSTTQFWNEDDWACQDCPGEWLPKPVKPSRGRQSFNAPPTKCTCTASNQFFNEKTVKCVPCPTGSTATSRGCVCPTLQSYKAATNTCDCRSGYVKDAAGTGCVTQAVAPASTSAPLTP